MSKELPEARARQVFSLRSVYFVALLGGAFLLWWVETQTMAGTHSSHVYTMEEVLGMLDLFHSSCYHFQKFKFVPNVFCIQFKVAV